MSGFQIIMLCWFCSAVSMLIGIYAGHKFKTYDEQDNKVSKSFEQYLSKKGESCRK